MRRPVKATRIALLEELQIDIASVVKSCRWRQIDDGHWHYRQRPQRSCREHFRAPNIDLTRPYASCMTICMSVMTIERLVLGRTAGLLFCGVGGVRSSFFFRLLLDT